ncbi:Clavaminate synthase-like protein [Hymenopellis radicata]|nr:Clavaminate synthase-like protein [Hymenopellis radicata]
MTLSWVQDFARELLEGLDDEDIPQTALAIACGKDNFARLKSAAVVLCNETADETVDALDELLTMSCAALALATGALILCWRQFTVDTHILRSLTHLDASTCVEAVGLLDRALIITGGAGRFDAIHFLIAKIQSDFAPSFTSVQFPLRPQTDSIATTEPLSAHLRLPSLPEPPSLSLFRTKFCREPFVLRGYAKDWPAVSERPWRSLEYLRSISGPGRVVPVEVGSDYRTADWSQKLLGWDEFLVSLSSPSSDGPLYLAQHNMFIQFPQLREDIVVPDYVYTAPSAPLTYPTYVPPGNEEQLVLNTWLGPKGTISPAHTDPYFNVYVQVVGSKSVWLAPPESSEYMYSYRSPLQPTNEVSEHKEPSMSNTSRVDVFCTTVDTQYPDFWERVVPRASFVTLEPGDVLFFPPGWWHAMRANDISFSVSMWF